ncbi:hypothetical protein Ciccas_014366 [Cichlidogyrus casuarinus]|uniref:Secreted protein n=1 Tax=Cichlidogyrus casuarinus TaxID=1844966 RepID=A0ABD2PJM4_9PLAT
MLAAGGAVEAACVVEVAPSVAVNVLPPNDLDSAAIARPLFEAASESPMFGSVVSADTKVTSRNHIAIKKILKSMNLCKLSRYRCRVFYT